MSTGEGRVCSKCGEYKEWENYAINSKGLNGRKSVCKVCSNNTQKELARKRREEDPNKVSKDRREKHLLREYGLSLDCYETLLKSQGRKCAICGTDANYHGKELFVDHCHETGKVRGLLCGLCNTGLGALGDDKEGVFKALRYLERFERENV